MNPGQMALVQAVPACADVAVVLAPALAGPVLGQGGRGSALRRFAGVGLAGRDRGGRWRGSPLTALRHSRRRFARQGGQARHVVPSEQVPVLVAADRGGMTVSAVLPAVNADALWDPIEPVVDDDIVVVSDGHRAYPPCAATMCVRHEALNLCRGERVRSAFHIQTVNSRHGQLKGFLRRCPGIATKYLDNCLRWLQQVELDNASPRTCLANAIDTSCIRFGN